MPKTILRILAFVFLIFSQNVFAVNYLYTGGGVSGFSSMQSAADAAMALIRQQNSCTAESSTFFCPTAVSNCTEPADVGSWLCDTNSSSYRTIGGQKMLDQAICPAAGGDGGNVDLPTGTGPAGGNLPEPSINNFGKTIYSSAGDRVVDDVLDCTSTTTGDVKYYSCTYSTKYTGTCTANDGSGGGSGSTTSGSTTSGSTTSGSTTSGSTTSGSTTSGSTTSGSTTSGSTTSGSTTSGSTTSGSTTSGDGSTTSGSTTSGGTTTTTTTSGDGSTTSGSTTSGDGSTTSGSTTSGSTTSGDGSTTSGSTTSGSTTSGDEPPKDDFCSQNPNLTICKNSSVSGDCENLTCEGDAIQCAILRQNMKTWCENNEKNDQYKLGSEMANGSDPLGSSLPNKANGTTLDFSSTPLNSDGFLGGGSCIADKTFTVSGMTVKLPFAQVCPYLLPMRAATMIAAFLAAYFMLSGVILRS